MYNTKSECNVHIAGAAYISQYSRKFIGIVESVLVRRQKRDGESGNKNEKKEEEEGRKRKEISMQEMEIMAKGKVANMRVIRL